MAKNQVKYVVEVKIDTQRIYILENVLMNLSG